MAITLILTDFVNTLDLNPAYSGGQADFKPHEQGFQIGQADTMARWHEPTQGLAQLLDLSDKDLFCSFPFQMDGSAAEVDRNLTLLRRWIKGENQQAAMAELDENVRPVYLQFKKDNSANNTYFRVRLGDIDESQAHITAAKGGNVGRVYRAVANLRFRPWGTTQDPYWVNNVIVGSSNFYRIDPSTSLPFGVTEVGTPTTTVVTDKALVAGKSLHIVTDSADEGIYMTANFVPRWHLTIVAMWLIVLSGTWDIEVTDTSNNVIYSVTGITAANIAANADATTNDRNENAWYLYTYSQLSGEIDVNESHRIRLMCTTSSGEAYTDAWSEQSIQAINFIEHPTTPVQELGDEPEGWQSNWVSFTFMSKNITQYLNTTASYNINIPGASSYVQTNLFDREEKGRTYTARFWFHPNETTGDPVLYSLRDSANNIVDSTTIDPGNVSGYVTSVVGQDTNTWYLYELSGVSDDAPGIRFRINHTGAGTVSGDVGIDDIYLYRGTGPTFNRVQVFGRQIVNANETAGTSYANYIDVFNVPGDLDAAIDMRFRLGEDLPAGGYDLMVNRQVERRWRMINHTFEAEEGAGYFTEGSAGAGSWNMDSTAVSGTSGAGHVRFTGGNGAGGYIQMGFNPDDALAWTSVERMPRFRWRTNNTATATLQFKWVDSTGGAFYTGKVHSLSTANNWVLTADDEAFKRDLSPKAGLYFYQRFTNFQIHVDVTSGGTVDIDYWEAVPVGNENYMRTRIGWAPPGGTIIIDGDEKQVVQIGGGYRYPGTGSGVWTAAHGYNMTRYIFAWVNSTGIHDISDNAYVNIGIKPRSRLFLSDI